MATVPDVFLIIALKETAKVIPVGLGILRNTMSLIFRDQNVKSCYVNLLSLSKSFAKLCNFDINKGQL